MRTRIKYSQNFLKDKKLISDLLEKSSIQKNDLVYEIGAGEGVITEALIKKGARVVAFEIDLNLFNKLKDKFRNINTLRLIHGDFLNYSLSKQSYKVFSNIPFNITSTIVKKFTLAEDCPEDVYLIVQKEAGDKFLGKPFDRNNSLLSTLIKSRFEITIFYKFNRDDFYPKPNVDTVFMRIKKQKEPYVPKKDIITFFDFVTFVYNQFEPNILKGMSKVIPEKTLIELAKQHSFSVFCKPSELEFKNWILLFQQFNSTTNRLQRGKVLGSFKKMQNQQQALQKIHRTRLDKNWRNY